MITTYLSGDIAYSIHFNCNYHYNNFVIMNDITKCELSAYLLGKTLGRGTFGKVKLGMHKVTGQPVAIKVLEKAKIKDVTDVERVSRELHILKITQHSSIAQMYEIIQTELNIFIVMQYAPRGQFFDYIMDAKIKSQQQAHHYFVQIVSGLEYLHLLGVSHRDIKPQNMLLDDYSRLKIVDFGLSNMYRPGQFLLTACGSPCYASPEMIKGEQYDPQLTDVWSLGVVLFSMIFAKLPFEDDNTSVLYGKIKSGLYVIDKKISPQLKDLLSKLLCVKPKLRLNIKGIKEHPWYKKEKICKCHGIVVGYETAPLDEEVLTSMSNMGYNIEQSRKYLENNIRNEVTTAYYLLLKKKFKVGNPSPHDISNQNFNRKSIMPKCSKVKASSGKIRHHSLDITSLNQSNNKQTLQVEDYMFSSKKLKKMDSSLKKERNCFSQMKNEEYESFSNMKSAEIYKGGMFKKSIKERYQQKNRRENLSKEKKSDSFKKFDIERRKSLNNNISINVYINNAKIETPGKQKQRRSNSKLDKQFISSKNQNQIMTSLKAGNRRLKTEMIEDMKSENKAINRYGNKEYDTQSKSLQKSHEISLIGSNFWKKKTANNRRQYTAESRNEHRRSKTRKI